MKANLSFLAMILAGSLMLGTSAHAELVGGKVVNVDPGSKTLTINQTNLETEAQENIKVRVIGQTDLLGLESFSNIKVGDEVWVEAEEDYVANNWIASSIQRIAETESA